MSPVGLCIWTPGHQLVMFFGEAVEPLGGASLLKRWTLEISSLVILLVLSLFLASFPVCRRMHLLSAMRYTLTMTMD